MTKEQIELIPMDWLIDEIQRRTDACIIAYTRTEDPGAPMIYWTSAAKKNWTDLIALCEETKLDVKLNRRLIRAREND